LSTWEKLPITQVLLVLFGSATVSATWASTFIDNVFNLSDYSTRTEQTGGATIDISQTLAGGNPGTALQIITHVPSGNSFRGNEYFLNNAFIYDPATQGSIQSLGYSEDVYVGLNGISLSSKSGDLLIFQNGNYFVHFISLPTVNNVWSTASAENLDFSNFSLISNLATGATDSSQHPDFANGILQFGLVSFVFVNGNYPTVTTDIRLDNLLINVTSAPVPVPAAFWLMTSSLISFRIFGAKRGLARRCGEERTSSIANDAAHFVYRILGTCPPVFFITPTAILGQGRCKRLALHYTVTQ
jgi:hypothetical protein